jgi:hypothetical protein
MSNVVVFTSPTLDGGHAGAGRPDKDPVLGSGRRLVADGGPVATLRLLDNVATTTGVPVTTYQPTRTRRRARAPRSEPEHARSGS